MIKSIFILIVMSIGVAGCETIYESSDKTPYGSREYYRVVESEPIGVAIWEEMNLSNTLTSIKDQIKQEATVKDVIILAHKEEIVVALKPYAYDRGRVGDILTKYSDWFEEQGMNVALLTAPNHYRKAKQMMTIEEIDSESWEAEWGDYFSK